MTIEQNSRKETRRLDGGLLVMGRQFTDESPDEVEISLENDA